MFGLFCACFIIVIYQQLNISLCFTTNSAIRRSLLQSSVSSDTETSNFVNFEQINVEQSYWDWLRQFAQAIYRDTYYSDYPIPENKRFSIPNLNRVISPLRLTQRRMKLVPNADPYTSRYVSEGWATYGFDYLDSLDTTQEETSPFMNGTSLYTKETSFYRLGGYV
jgi:hypothetical protein